MNDKKNSSSLRAIFAILALFAVLLIANLIYMFKMTSDLESVKSKSNPEKPKIYKSDLEYTLAQKDTMMKNLSKLKAVCDNVISQNTSMSQELISEREKVVALMGELQKAHGDTKTLEKYKSQQNKIGGSVSTLLSANKVKVADMPVFKTKDTARISKRPKKVERPLENKKPSEVIVVKKIEEPKKHEESKPAIDKPLKISMSNIAIAAYKETSSGKKELTDKVSKANFLKISFSVMIDNPTAKSSSKTYYVQIIDARNNVIGKRKTQFFVDKLLTYSFETQIKTDIVEAQVNEYLAGQNFEKGYYFLNIFDKDVLVAKSSFSLK